MEKLCECNSNWVLGARARHGQVALESTQENFYLAWEEFNSRYDTCPVCDFWQWYDGQYEDMMVDLREMNRC